MGLVFSHSLATSSHYIKEAWIKDNAEEVLDEFRGRELDGIKACSINARLQLEDFHQSLLPVISVCWMEGPKVIWSRLKLKRFSDDIFYLYSSVMMDCSIISFYKKRPKLKCLQWAFLGWPCEEWSWIHVNKYNTQRSRLKIIRCHSTHLMSLMNFSVGYQLMTHMNHTHHSTNLHGWIQYDTSLLWDASAPSARARR